MAPHFLTRPLRRLRADGALETLPVTEPAIGRATVLLSRELCRFERVRPPASLSRSAALAATRLHAATRAPFTSPGWVVARRGADLGVWWWDGDRVTAALSALGLNDPVRLRPEAAAQSPGEGWRILRADGGFEAQHWQGGYLMESAWRRSPFDAAAWRSLTRSPDAAAPPLPGPAIVVSGSAYGRRFVEARSLAAGAPSLIAGALLLSLGLSAFLLGRGVGHARQDAALRAQIATASPAQSRRPQLAARARALGEVARLVDAPGPLETLAEARTVLQRFGLRVIAFDAQRGELSVVVPGSAVAGVDLLVQELERSPRLRDVRPTLDREAGRLTLRMSVRA